MSNFASVPGPCLRKTRMTKLACGCNELNHDDGTLKPSRWPEPVGRVYIYTLTREGWLDRVDKLFVMLDVLGVHCLAEGTTAHAVVRHTGCSRSMTSPTERLRERASV